MRVQYSKTTGRWYAQRFGPEWLSPVSFAYIRRARRALRRAARAWDRRHAQGKGRIEV